MKQGLIDKRMVFFRRYVQVVNIPSNNKRNRIGELIIIPK